METRTPPATIDFVPPGERGWPGRKLRGGWRPWPPRTPLVMSDRRQQHVQGDGQHVGSLDPALGRQPAFPPLHHGHHRPADADRTCEIGLSEAGASAEPAQRRGPAGDCRLDSIGQARQRTAARIDPHVQRAADHDGRWVINHHVMIVILTSGDNPNVSVTDAIAAHFWIATGPPPWPPPPAQQSEGFFFATDRREAKVLTSRHPYGSSP